MENRKKLEHYRDLTKKTKDKLSTWKTTVLPEIEQDAVYLREDLLEDFYKNEAVAFDRIQLTDALVTLPLFLRCLKQAKRVNDKRLDDLLKDAGVILKRADLGINDKNPSDTITDFFSPLFQDPKKNIVNIFEDFIYNEVSEKENFAIVEQKITQESLDKKINSVLDMFFNKLKSAYKNQASAIDARKEELANLLRIDIFLSCAIKAYTGSDNAQKMDGIWEKGVFKATWMYGTQLRKPFLALKYCLANLKIPLEDQQLWHEMRMYLSGFYERVYHLMPAQHKDAEGRVLRNPDGTFAPVDPQDADMQANFQHLSKFQMVIYNLYYIATFKKILKPKEQVPRKAQIPNQSQDNELFVARNNRKFKVEENALTQQLRAFKQQGEKTQEQEARELFRLLQEQRCLTPNQELMLRMLPEYVRDECNEYIKGGTSTIEWLFKGYFLWNRPHTPDANKLIKDVYDHLNDAEYQLNEIFKLYIKLSKEGSGHLQFNLLNVLHKAYDVFIKGVPDRVLEEQQRSQVAASPKK